jgi:hypothetical protein
MEGRVGKLNLGRGGGVVCLWKVSGDGGKGREVKGGEEVVVVVRCG